MTKKQVEKVLKTIDDPELGVNIVDLGLIYKIEISDKEGQERVHVLMTLTTPGCPLGGWFLDQVTTVVSKGMNLERNMVTVEITFDPPWSQDLMTEEVKATLGF